jgi:hypothetical protein
MLYRANSYELFGAPKEGKIHGIREPDSGSFHTICGLTAKSCPGELVEGKEEEITCKNCLTKLGRLTRIYWECGDHDGQPEWYGYVNGEERYRVSRGGWCVLDELAAGDSCVTDREARACCQEHLNQLNKK